METQRRERLVLVVPINAGDPCPPVSEVRSRPLYLVIVCKVSPNLYLLWLLWLLWLLL